MLTDIWVAGGAVVPGALLAAHEDERGVVAPLTSDRSATRCWGAFPPRGSCIKCSDEFSRAEAYWICDPESNPEREDEL
jgi:hypothetical protein